MKKNDYFFFQNSDCAYFPCHSPAGEEFNCLFCYCPLYALGEKCGGNYSYNEQNIKDCSACLIPHREGGYEYILSKFPDVAELAKRKDE